jgi:hypothetical protein
MPRLFTTKLTKLTKKGTEAGASGLDERRVWTAGCTVRQLAAGRRSSPAINARRLRAFVAKFS